MRRIVLIVPGLVRAPAQESVLRQTLPTLRVLAELGDVSKLARLPDVQTPEALYLGMSPSEAQMPQGPLTVAALGADPPDRSLHFHLSLLSLQDEVLRGVDAVDPAEARAVMDVAARLNTPTLTTLMGEGTNHGLVLERQGDLGTTTASDAEGKRFGDVLPEGDFERPLRRFIDDSVNLLSDLEINRIRTEEGRLAVNVLWPWGQGLRPRVPNLVIRRGERATVESDSMRLAGLTRLTGYVHEDRRLLGSGVGTRFGQLASRILDREVTIVLFRAPEDEEPLEWFVRELDRLLLKPLVDSARLTPTRITILAPGDPVGLALRVEMPSLGNATIPFDERAFEERTVPTRGLADEVERGVLE